MKSLKLVVFVAGLCLTPQSVVQPIQAASPVVGILQTELQRNFSVLSKEQTPAYFLGYTVHDERSSTLIASLGALERTDESRGRFATVEVRVGEYALDNTHPLRGDGGGVNPRTGRISLPLTDDDKPIQLSLWRATDRAFKQGTEALTRVTTNVAAKVKEESPAPDFSRE